MKNKKLLFFIVLLIILIFLAFLVLGVHFFKKQPPKIENTEAIVVFSLCDKKNQAIVKSGISSSLSLAYKDAYSKIAPLLEQNPDLLQWVKLDIIKDCHELSLAEWKRTISSFKNYSYRKGLILPLEDRKIVLTEAELNSNMIIDYRNHTLSLTNLNRYLKKCKEPQVKQLPQNLISFSTTSLFYENGNIYELHSDGPDTGRRKLETLQKSDIDLVVDSSTSYLSNLVQDTGRFIYGYQPLKNKEDTDYNILRHAGSVWALIANYNGTNEQKEKIDLSLSYLNNTLVYNGNCAYVVEEKSNEIKLGGNALAMIAMCEYTNQFNDTKYLETIKKLGNGVLSMQTKQGSYVHILNLDFSTKNKYRTVYYDGEATFALAKLYGITKDETYLEAAKKALTYFATNDYTQYADHWISYATNEITKYVNDTLFYELGLKNIAYNMDKIATKTYPSHTNFEMLLQGFELYHRIVEHQISFDYLNSFPAQDFIKLVQKKANFQLNSYLFPEMAMYLENPTQYTNTFFVRNSSFRIRIDDVQHSILGYHFYQKNFDLIK